MPFSRLTQPQATGSLAAYRHDHAHPHHHRHPTEYAHTHHPSPPGRPCPPSNTRSLALDTCLSIAYAIQCLAEQHHFDE